MEEAIGMDAEWRERERDGEEDRERGVTELRTREGEDRMRG
jgi:hypothetical protein